jgi:hypothetical protein
MEDSLKKLRSFGLIVGSAFGVIGVWPLLFRGQPVRIWAISFSCFLVISALVIPTILGPVYRVWMKIGYILGWINSRIILSLVFYIVFTPVGFFMRLFKRDPLNRKFQTDAKTYRENRQPRPGSHMKHQF